MNLSRDQFGVKVGGKNTIKVENPGSQAELPQGYRISKGSMGWALHHKGVVIRTSSDKLNLISFSQEHCNEKR